MTALVTWLLSTYAPEDVQELYADYDDIRNRFPEPVRSLAQFAAFRSLEHLRLSGHQLADVDGLHYFPFLKTLILRENTIQNAVFQGAGKYLQDIDLSENPLHDICFPHPDPAVTDLDISRTSLERLPDLSSCSHLRRLTCNGNGLSGIPPGLLPPSLEELYLRHSRVQAADIENLPKGLRKLRIGTNEVPTGMGNRFADLEILYLHRLQGQVRLEGLQRLEVLAMEWTREPEDFRLIDLPVLHTLLVPGFPSEHLPDLNRFPALRRVRCSHTPDQLPRLRDTFPQVQYWE